MAKTRISRNSTFDRVPRYVWPALAMAGSGLAWLWLQRQAPSVSSAGVFSGFRANGIARGRVEPVVERSASDIDVPPAP